MREEVVLHHEGAVELEGFAVHGEPSDARRPVVMVAHAWGGQGALERQRAAELAALGYVGFALDLYGRGRRGGSREENQRLKQPLLEDRSLLLRRMRAGLEAARNLPACDGRVAAVGYCFGGLCVLDLARSGSDVLGVVSFHGLLDAPDLPRPKAAKAKVLALHGYDDPMAPPDQLAAFQAELTERGLDWQVLAFGGTMHAFTNPAAQDPAFGTVYQPSAARRSWRVATGFLAELFERG